MSKQVLLTVPPLVSCAAQEPLCPPATLVRVIPVPEPAEFQPVKSVSNPEFFTKLTVSEAVLVFPPSLPVTVCEPPLLAIQTLPVHAPSGAIENVVKGVTSPIELFDESKPCAV